MIPLGGNELDDGVFRLLQPRTRLADNQAMDLPDIGGWEVTVLAAMLSCGAANHAGERRFDVQQRACDIHQSCVVRLLAPIRQTFDQADLVQNDPPWLTKTEHSERIGYLLERRL